MQNVPSPVRGTGEGGAQTVRFGRVRACAARRCVAAGERVHAPDRATFRHDSWRKPFRRWRAGPHPPIRLRLRLRRMGPSLSPAARGRGDRRAAHLSLPRCPAFGVLSSWWQRGDRRGIAHANCGASRRTPSASSGITCGIAALPVRSSAARCRSAVSRSTSPVSNGGSSSRSMAGSMRTEPVRTGRVTGCSNTAGMWFCATGTTTFWATSRALSPRSQTRSKKADGRLPLLWRQRQREIDRP